MLSQRKEDERHQSGTEERLDVALGGSPAGHFSNVANPFDLGRKRSKRPRFAGSHGRGPPSSASDKGLADDVIIGPMPNTHNPRTGEKQTRAAQIQAAFLCGVINGIITIPVMTSFAAIIFQAR